MAENTITERNNDNDSNNIILSIWVRADYNMKNMYNNIGTPRQTETSRRVNGDVNIECARRST